MRKIILLFMFPLTVFSQEKNSSFNVDVNDFYGKILNHSDHISQLTDQSPEGAFISFNKFTVETQFGYYAYRPLDYLDPIYQRLGLKYYLAKQISLGVGLKNIWQNLKQWNF